MKNRVKYRKEVICKLSTLRHLKTLVISFLVVLFVGWLSGYLSESWLFALSFLMMAFLLYKIARIVEKCKLALYKNGKTVPINKFTFYLIERYEELNKDEDLNNLIKTIFEEEK